MEWFFEAFERLTTSQLLHRAWLGGAFIALVGPALGVFLVLRRYALFSEGIGHIVFGGIGLSFFLKLHPIWTALVTAIISALGIEHIRSQRRLSGDLAIAIFLTFGLGSGLLLARLGGESARSIERYLFGSLLSIRSEDIWTAGILAAIVLVALILIGKELFAITFDEESAQVGGIPSRWLNRLLAVLAAVTIVASMRITGILLASALVILPTAASLQIARSFLKAVLFAVMFGLLTISLGVVIVSIFPNIILSGTIVCAGVFWFVVSWTIHWVQQRIKQ